MKTIIHDLEHLDKKLFNISDNDVIINANGCSNSCIGCFSCWIKHPKVCIYKDEYSNITDSLKNSDELIIISKNRFGCYSESVPDEIIRFFQIWIVFALLQDLVCNSSHISY